MNHQKTLNELQDRRREADIARDRAWEQLWLLVVSLAVELGALRSDHNELRNHIRECLPLPGSVGHMARATRKAKDERWKP